MKKILHKLFILLLAVIIIVPADSIVSQAKTKRVLYSTFKKTVNMKVGKSKTLNITYKKHGDIYYEVSDDEIVSTYLSDNSGKKRKLKVKALKPGNATITITGDKTKQKVKFKIKVKGDQGNNNNDKRSDTESPTIKYLADYEVEHNSAYNEQRVFFSLQTADQTRVSASGTADISIVNNSGEQVYNKSITFNSEDFGYWTKNNNTRYLCCLKIPDDNIMSGKSKSGTVALTIKLANVYFVPVKMSAYNLPAKDASNYLTINLPSTGNLVKVTGGQQGFVLTSVTYDVYRNTNNTYEVTLRIRGIKAYDEINRTYILVPFRLYDESGTIVRSFDAYGDSVVVGDSFEDIRYLHDLPEGTYTLALNN